MSGAAIVAVAVCAWLCLMAVALYIIHVSCEDCGAFREHQSWCRTRRHP